MAGHLPDSYGRLASYAHRFPSGTPVYEQGASLDRFFVVLRGRVDFEVVTERGDAEVVASAGPGDVAGHVAAFTGHVTSAAARAAGDSVLLSVPVDRALEVFREAPELALLLVRSFANPEQARAAPPRDDAVASAPPDVDAEAVIRVAGPVDDAWFFLDTTVCPVDGTYFEFVRVRTRAVRPAARDTDFHVRYNSVDPTRYSVLVCPSCGYAAYQDDFEVLEDEVRVRVWLEREARMPRLVPSLLGVRTAKDAETALELAIRCYELRGAGPSRQAVLYHRRAWVERERGDEPAEQAWLQHARDAYRAAFEQDTRLSDEAALRAAYLVGDLSLRLGEASEGAQWLETVIRRADEKTQSGLLRMSRERLHDARTLLRDERRAG